MNIHKHMEAIFVVTLAAVGLGSYATDNLVDADAATSVSATTPVMRAVAAPGVLPIVAARAPNVPCRA